MDKEVAKHKYTDAYYLSSYSRDDVPQIVHSLSNKVTAEQLRMVPSPYTVSDALAWFDLLEEEIKHPDTAPLRWVIRETSSGKLIGDLSLRGTAGTYSLGYWLAYEFWGQGIMTRVLSEVLEIVKQEFPKVKIVTAAVREHNRGSQRVLEKSGFRRVGEHRETSVIWDFELKL